MAYFLSLAFKSFVFPYFSFHTSVNWLSFVLIKAIFYAKNFKYFVVPSCLLACLPLSIPIDLGTGPLFPTSKTNYSLGLFLPTKLVKVLECLCLKVLVWVIFYLTMLHLKALWPKLLHPLHLIGFQLYSTPIMIFSPSGRFKEIVSR